MSISAKRAAHKGMSARFTLTKEETAMIDIRDPHSDVHSEHGALPGEHPGRANNPITKVHDVAWLEFEKPDLERTERFADAFGFKTAGAPHTNSTCAAATPAHPACWSARRRGHGSSARPSGRPTRAT
jgi:hypothetical protein